MSRVDMSGRVSDLVMIGLPVTEAWGSLLKHIREGVWVLDADGHVLSSNTIVERWLEQPRLRGTSCSEWIVEPSNWAEEGEASVEIRSASGIVRKVDMVTEALKDDKGQILGFLQVFTDHSTGRAFDAVLVEEVQRMARLAGEDPLTGLANRRAFDEALNHVRTDQSRRFGVIVIDLDGFKSINDSYGHRVGDRVLIAFGERIKGLVREDDLVARIGGDEFAVLLPHVTMVGLTEAAERLRDGLVVELDVNGSPLRVRGSVGYAHSGPDPATVVERADKWMYQHKATRESGGISALAEEEERINRRVG